MPKQFGRFTLHRKLGEGGMGSVFLVTDPAGTQFALKTLRADLTESGDFAQRFIRESGIARMLDHPHIVRTFEHGQGPNGTLYMLTEYCSHGGLDGVLIAQGRIGAPEALFWLAGIAGALDYAWQTHHVIHRDIKPANLLLDDRFDIKLADLGLARRADADATRLTLDGTIIGSVSYMSPEQALAARDLDVRSDLYALGATIYHLLSGDPVFEGSTAALVIKQHVQEPPEPLLQRRPELPPGMAALVHMLLQKDPERRPESPAELLERVHALAPGMGVKLNEFPGFTLRANIAADSVGGPAGDGAGAGRRPAGSTAAGGLSPDAAQRAAAAGVGDVGGWGGGGGGLARDPDLATLDLELPPAPTASALTAPNALTLLPALAPAASAREAAAGVSSAAVAAASGVAGSAALAVKGSGAIAPRADRAWLRLTWQEAPTPIDLAIFAAPTVTFGRASDGSVDLPLRLYPVAERKAECMQISSQHARFARTAAGWNLTDLHSHNGLTLNETRLAADLPVDLPNGAVIGLGGALQLRARLVRPAVPAQFRLDGQPFAPADPAALLLERLGNRADLVYALLADRLPIGGTDPRQALAAALPTSRSCGTLWWHAQQFWWQPVEPQTVEGRRVLPDQLAPLPSEALCWSAGPYTLVFRPLTLDLFR